MFFPQEYMPESCLIPAGLPACFLFPTGPPRMGKHMGTQPDNWETDECGCERDAVPCSIKGQGQLKCKAAQASVKLQYKSPFSVWLIRLESLQILWSQVSACRNPTPYLGSACRWSTQPSRCSRHPVYFCPKVFWFVRFFVLICFAVIPFQSVLRSVSVFCQVNRSHPV